MMQKTDRSPTTIRIVHLNQFARCRRSNMARELGIDENDLWIVAQAVERNLVLVTSDKMWRIRETVCELYPDFGSEDWAESSDLAGQDA